MKIAVTGANGFIGARFIELFGDEFDEIVKLNKVNSPLNDLYSLIENTKSVDILVHTAFDPLYKDNILGVKNIIEACKHNKIKKIVHISSFSVYDPDTIGELTESSAYSKLNDPYSKEKRFIEQELEVCKELDVDVVILQPTIVYGVGGNWTKSVLYSCMGGSVSLPYEGRRFCNIVYVDDVANAIFQSCLSDVNYDKFLISGMDTITWYEFYNMHRLIVKNLGVSVSCEIGSCNTNEFHDNLFMNFFYYLWLKTNFGSSLNYMAKTVRRYTIGFSRRHIAVDELNFLFNSNQNKMNFVPFGMSRKVHSANFIVSSDKAKKQIGYKPYFDIDQGFEKLEMDLREIYLK